MVNLINKKYTIEQLEFIISEHKLEKKYWDCICYYQVLTEDFIEKYKKKLDWCCLCQCQKMSEPFLKKHLRDISWDHLLDFNRVSVDFIIKHIKKIPQRSLIIAIENYPIPKYELLKLLANDWGTEHFKNRFLKVLKNSK